MKYSAFHREYNLEILLPIYAKFFYALMTCFTWALPAFGTGALPATSERDTLEALERRIRGVSAFGEELLLFPEDKDFVIGLAYPGKTGTRESFFGKLTDQERITLDTKTKRMWVSGYGFDGFLMFFDSLNLEFFFVNRKTKAIVSSNQVPWDLIKPPRDRGGEPTTFEIKEAREKFRKAFRKKPLGGITGLAIKEKRKDGGLDFFMSSNIPGFPLLELGCRAKNGDFYQCQVERYCFINTSFKESYLSGIGYSPKRKVIILADAKKSELIYLKYNSCYSVTLVGRTSLPEKFKKVSGVAVDEEDTLWVSTLEPDDYLNASLFRWESSAW